MTNAVLMLSSFLNLFASPVAIPLLGDQAYPESVSYHHARRSFFVSCSGDGSVEEVGASGQVRYFSPPGADDRTEAYGLKVDEGRDRLWLVDGKSIFIYRISSGRLEKRIDRQSLGAVSDSFLNDIAIDSAGNAFVTDSRNASLVVISGIDLAPHLRPVPEVPYGNQNGVKYNLNGIVMAPDGKSLLSVKTNDGTLWRIPLAEEEAATEVRLSVPVTHGDGLAWSPEGELFVMRNFEERISSINLATRQVKDLKLDGIVTPTAAAFTGEGDLIVVNSQFSRDIPALPFSLSRFSAAQRPLN